jgi:hypothetical protein
MQIKLKYFSKKKMRDKNKRLKKMTLIEVDGELMEQCDNCGNIWDGNAQCNCWQINHEEEEDQAADEEADDDSGYETE